MLKVEESVLRERIKSSVSKQLKEGVYKNIYGGPVGDSDNYRGCPTIKIRFHGEWSDPELLYNGYAANYWEIEDYLYECAKEEGLDADNDDVFDEYCQENEDEIQNQIIELGEKEEDIFEGITREEVKAVVAESLKRMMNESVEGFDPVAYWEQYGDDAEWDPYDWHGYDAECNIMLDAVDDKGNVIGTYSGWGFKSVGDKEISHLTFEYTDGTEIDII